MSFFKNSNDTESGTVITAGLGAAAFVLVTTLAAGIFGASVIHGEHESANKWVRDHATEFSYDSAVGGTSTLDGSRSLIQSGNLKVDGHKYYVHVDVDAGGNAELGLISLEDKYTSTYDSTTGQFTSSCGSFFCSLFR